MVPMDPNPIGVSFGVVETPVNGTSSLTKNITVENKGATNVTYNLTIANNPALLGRPIVSRMEIRLQ